jgi:hypothetical protein
MLRRFLNLDSQAEAAMEKIKGVGLALDMFCLLPMKLGRIAAVGVAIMFCASLAGCADSASSTYPTLSKIVDPSNILSPEERQKAVQDLQKQEQSHSGDAAKQIEKR